MEWELEACRGASGSTIAHLMVTSHQTIADLKADLESACQTPAAYQRLFDSQTVHATELLDTHSLHGAGITAGLKIYLLSVSIAGEDLLDWCADEDRMLALVRYAITCHADLEVVSSV